MIQNLNKLSFREYGLVSPQTPDQTGWQHPWNPIVLLSEEHPVFRAAGDTWLTGDRGMAVLSVSQDRNQWRDFYLDKPVMVNAGLYFSLSAMEDSALVHLASPCRPESAGQRPRHRDYQIRPKLQIRHIATFFYQEKEQGFLFPGEAHPVVELTYVDQGSLHSVADGQDFLLEQGDLVLYGPNQWHMQYSDVEVAPRFLTVSFDAGDYDLRPLMNRKFRSPQKAISLLQKMLQEQERMDECSADMMLSYLTQVLLLLQRQTDIKADPIKSTHCLTNENEIIRAAQQYITNNIRSRLSVPVVAKNTDVSPSYLTALFHKHLQIAPGEYIRRIKLQESKQMIREGNMNFTEIAAALQYSTIHHFSRQFKEKFGVTPTQYAKSIR